MWWLRFGWYIWCDGRCGPCSLLVCWPCGGSWARPQDAIKVHLMSKYLMLVLGLLLLLLFAGCRRNNWLLGDKFQRSVTLKVKSIDSTTFVNYYDIVFRNKSGKPGGILVDKAHGYLPAYLLPGVGFQSVLLGDLNEFRSGEEGLIFQGHGANGGFYVDGVLRIDLSPSAKRPYYRIVEKQ